MGYSRPTIRKWLFFHVFLAGTGFAQRQNDNERRQIRILPLPVPPESNSASPVRFAPLTAPLPPPPVRIVPVVPETMGPITVSRNSKNATVSPNLDIVEDQSTEAGSIEELNEIEKPATILTDSTGEDEGDDDWPITSTRTEILKTEDRSTEDMTTEERKILSAREPKNEESEEEVKDADHPTIEAEEGAHRRASPNRDFDNLRPITSPRRRFNPRGIRQRP